MEVRIRIAAQIYPNVKLVLIKFNLYYSKRRKAVHGLSGHLSWEVFVFSRRTIMEWQGMESCILKRSKSGI